MAIALRYNRAMPKEVIEYQKLSNELDMIVAKLQGGDIDIDEATELYEKGADIVKKLEAYLKTTENKIEKIKASRK